MDPAAHRAFTATLLARLSSDPGVIGLVMLGSGSGEPPGPDAFSDHDFFVVVPPGAQERWRTGLDWLPDATSLVLSFRETAHGVKALYASGHLAEFAVFDPDELALAWVNRWAVLLDRGGVAERMAAVRRATELSAPAPADARWLAGQFLTQLVVGVGRWARGERLSGHQLVRVAALGQLVSLLRAGLPAGHLALLDDLDPFRRLERALPAEAAVLEAALLRPVPAAARGLLELAARARPELVPGPARQAVERAIAAAEQVGAERGGRT
jgi:hypothetical protein